VTALTPDFFRRDPLLCARELIGCRFGVGETAGVIVETEAYTAEDDPACHTWKRQGARDFVAARGPGMAYVYLNYGMHWLFNFLVKGGERDERDGFVLIRALEPVAGTEMMQERRKRSAIDKLCNGPAKLTQALGIHGGHHGYNPFATEGWTLTAPEVSPKVLISTRIGISQATDFPWRFLLSGSRGVSSPA